MVLNLIFLGPPGGKGTVAQAVADKYSLVQISTGDLIRAEVSAGTEIGCELKEIMNKGELVSDELVAKMLEEKLKEIYASESSGIILDGFPRTIPQANELENIFVRLGKKLTAVIYIESSEENIVKRLSARWTCSKCKKVYNTLSNPSKLEGVCDMDGGELIQRDDDKEETIRARLATFNEKTTPLVKYYTEKNLLKSYDGNVPPLKSIERAEEIIDSLTK